MQKSGGILGRRCQRLLLQLLLHLSKGLLIQEENKYWLQYSYFFILLDPLNRAVQGYRQHFAHKAGLIVCQGQLFSLLRRNSLLCPCQNHAPFVTKKHSISMSDVPQIRKNHLRYHTTLPLLRLSGSSMHLLPAQFVRPRKREEPSASFWLFRVFCFWTLHL